MKRFVIIGKPNVGKTLFMLNYAFYLGARSVRLKASRIDGTGPVETETNIPDAMSQLVREEPHTTRHSQSIIVEMRVRKGKKPIELIDTAGITEGIHPDAELRKGMAQALLALRDADLIIHMVDASAMAGNEEMGILGDADWQIMEFGRAKGRYLFLANKMDLPEAKEGLERLQNRLSQELPDIVPVPISALHKTGFGEVHRFMKRFG